MTTRSSRFPAGGFNALVPEFDVFDLQESLAFWCDGLGFGVAYDRPERGFAYLDRERAQVMLCGINGNWETGRLERPLGRGINFQITVSGIAPILASLHALEWPLFEEPHVVWYRTGNRESGYRQFLVQDPNGYLLRPSEGLGFRPIPPVGECR